MTGLAYNVESESGARPSPKRVRISCLSQDSNADQISPFNEVESGLRKEKEVLRNRRCRQHGTVGISVW